LPVKGPRTLNGLITEHLESLPRIGTGLLIAKYPIEIIEVRANRVKVARIFPKLVTKEDPLYRNSSLSQYNRCYHLPISEVKALYVRQAAAVSMTSTPIP